MKRAGPIIFTLAILIWAGTTFPHYEETNQTARIEHSYLGKAGQMIEPIFKPMGIDWQGGVGLLSAFAAREVFVSTMAILYNITEDDEDRLTDSLIGKMKAAKWKGWKSNLHHSFCCCVILFLCWLYSVSPQPVGHQRNELLVSGDGTTIGMNLFCLRSRSWCFSTVIDFLNLSDPC